MKKKSRYHLIIFDLDGTLVDTAPDVQFSMNILRAELGLSPISLAETKKCIGPGPELFVKYITSNKKNSNLKIILKKFRQIYSQHLLEKTSLFPGIKKTVQKLYQAGIKLVVVTNKPGSYARQILKGLEIDQYFLSIIGPEDVKNQKPAPDPIIKAMDITKTSPSETLMVGDTEYDIKAARAAQVDVWAVKYGYSSEQRLKQLSPNVLIEHSEDIFHLL